MINIVHTICSHRGYTALKTNVSHWELAEWPPDFWQLRKVYLSQTIVGILGIFSLLYLYLFLYYSKCRLRPTDSILKHLTTVTSWPFPLKVSQRQGQPLVEACLLWLSTQILFSLLTKLAEHVHGHHLPLKCLQSPWISPRKPRWVEFEVKLPLCSSGCCICWQI